MANLQQLRIPHVCIYGLRLLLLSLMLTMAASIKAGSSGFRSPDECLAYKNNAHLNCLYAYIEIQQDKIVELESTINKQSRTAQQLEANVTQQRSLNRLLEQRISDQENDFRSYQIPRLHIFSRFSYNFIRPRYHRRFFQPHIGSSLNPYYHIW